MEYYFFIIIVIIVLKILFWTFYFYVRAQRLRQTQTMQRFIIVGAEPVSRGRNPYSDRSAIIDHAEPVSATGPPPYAEVVKDGSRPLPPPYDQVMAAPHAVPGPAMSGTSGQGSSRGAVGENTAFPPFAQASAPALSDGMASTAPYNPSGGHVASQPGGYAQPFGGQFADRGGVCMGKNFPVPPQ